MTKTCGCGRTYRDLNEFKSLCELKGEWFGLLLANCECGSTIAMELYSGSNKDAIEAFKAYRARAKGA